MRQKRSDFYQNEIKIQNKWWISILSFVNFFLYLYGVTSAVQRSLTEIQSLLFLYSWNIAIIILWHTVKEWKENSVITRWQILNFILGLIVFLSVSGSMIYGFL